MQEMSEDIRNYLDTLEVELKQAYDVASLARSKGYDPKDHVEIVLARNMHERIEGLIGTIVPQIKNSGMTARLEELEKEFGVSDFRVALTIALEIAQEKFCKFDNKQQALEVGIRTGIAYTTVGVVASPLEGFLGVKIRKTRSGEDYLALQYAGPIRSAGGTSAALSVVIADYVRKKKGYAAYDPTDIEVRRTITEIYDYHDRVTNLQYYPSDQELEFLTRNIPVQIDGPASEDRDVSNYKDLDRIETNQLRNGICLVLAEGVAQKARKLQVQLKKISKSFDLGHWKFIDKFLDIQKKVKGKLETKKDDEVTPDYTYISDLVAGRPVLTHPLARGGLRLRYGRTRTSGFSSDAIHPATMVILDDYIAVGTQLKVERPGKSTALTICDSIEGPIVKLKDASVRFLDTTEEAQNCLNEIEEILFLGDILINYGDFYNRGHKLIPVGYCEEWHALELELKIKSKKKDVANDKVFEFIAHPFKNKFTIEEAIDIATTYDVALHPRYTYHWADLKNKEFVSLCNWLAKCEVIREDNKIVKIKFPLTFNVADINLEDPKRVLEVLGVPHKVENKNEVVLDKQGALAFAANIGFLENDLTVETLNKYIEYSKNHNILEVITKFSKIKIRDKSGTYIGARMGRPEKSKLRKLTGSPQVLFPVGEEGGRMRSFQSALEAGFVKSSFPTFYCNRCEKETIYPRCDVCDTKTEKRLYCRYCNAFKKEDRCELHGDLISYKEIKLNIGDYFNSALKKLNLSSYPELIKGVRGTSNKDHIPENLAKGILRAKHNLYVNRDGTIRYDMTELGITSFKPNEIKTSVDKLKQLGYDKDIYGNELVNNEQVLELKPQDIILPACEKTLEEGADKILLKISKFVDDLLNNLYGLKPYYNFKKPDDIIGSLVVGLSPHTSAGILGRVIGFSNTQGLFAHPIFHSIMRRDADGDEACIVLLLDALLNFSRDYLPSHRGVTQDAPLVLTSRLITTEVDDMVFDMDVVFKYPLELYEAALEYKDPWDIKIEQLRHRLYTPKQYGGFGFTHPVSHISRGVVCSAYKSLPTMKDKVKGQLALAEKIRAVDENDVARLVIERHFIRDIKGNLRQFGMQQYRCSKCNEKYRRVPLAGKCWNCKGNIIFTVSEGTIIKYFQPTIEMAEKYDLPDYLKHTIDLTKKRIESVFGKEVDKQIRLSSWF